MLQTFLLFLFLIFLNAAFASAEIAVISISDARLKNLAIKFALTYPRLGFRR